MNQKSLGSSTAEIEMLLTEKFGVAGRGLEQKLAMTRYALPYEVLEQAEFLSQTLSRCQSSNRPSVYDIKRVQQARDVCVGYLERLEPQAYPEMVWQPTWMNVTVNATLSAMVLMVVLMYFHIL